MPALVALFTTGFSIVFLLSPVINWVAQRRNCCGADNGTGDPAIPIRKCWSDLRMTFLSVLLYVWVVGPLAFFLSSAADVSAAVVWADASGSDGSQASESRAGHSAAYHASLLLLFVCHSCQAVLSLLDPRWSLFWGFTPESSWRQAAPPPDLLLLTRSKRHHGEPARPCGTWWSVSNYLIELAMCGEAVGYVMVLGSGELEPMADDGATALLVLSSVFPLWLCALAVWDWLLARKHACAARHADPAEADRGNEAEAEAAERRP